MKTDELIGILATGARPVAPHRLEQRFGGAALLGLLALRPILQDLRTRWRLARQKY